MTSNPHFEARTAPYLEFTRGDRLSRALRYAGLGVTEVADMLGVTRETVSRWMNDRGTPKRAALLAWAAITNVSVEWLETGKVPEGATAPDELRARRDSNPKPSDLYLVWGSGTTKRVNPTLTTDRLPGNPRPRPTDPTRPTLLRVV